MKFGYKILIVLAVFLGALFAFSGGIQRNIFSSEAQVTTMSEATLPTVTIEVGGNEINLLHGYTSNLDEMIMRETITPLASDRTFTVLIEDNGANVKKLKYEILNEDGQKVEDGSLTVLDVESGPKKAEITLQETMKSGTEYVAKFTLITNESKRIYFYTRLKMYDDGHLAEKLAFVNNFHRILLTGTATEKETLTKYLESSKSSDNTTFADVNIKSSFEMVTWGELEPVQLWEQVPTVTEFYGSMASIQLKFLVSVETDSGTERYIVKENFRFNYTESRVYLYNYERNMEAIFDVANTSLAKNEFKLGITTDTDAETQASDSGKYIAFVYDRELMLYDADANELVEVFSFYQENCDYERAFYDAHEVSLLDVRENGDVDFCVYGYMNRGEYEGRVGIVLYTYINEERRIEERLYIPVSTSFQLLESDMTDLMYLSGQDIFYFSLYDSIYAYDLTTADMKVLAEGVPEENMLFIESESYVCWQESSDVLNCRKLTVLDLESGEERTVEAPEGETVRLYGCINDNLVYGLALTADAHVNPDGSTELPAYKLVIEDKAGSCLKEYRADGYYIDSIELGENIVTIKRVKKKLGTANVYVEAENDTILNQLQAEEPSVSVTRRITDRILTEYYVSLPSGVNIGTIPGQIRAVSTVINHDTMARLGSSEDREKLYYAYSFGEVIYESASAAETIAAADAAVGTVIDQDGKLIWERGVKSTRYEISGVTGVAAGGLTSIQAAAQTLLNYKNLQADASEFDSSRETLYEWLKDCMTGAAPVELTGASLDEVLYYVYKDRPVIAVRSDGSACVITGYDALTVTFYDPVRGRVSKALTRELEDDLEAAGSIFISYVN